MTSRLVILISGNGSNLQAIIDAIASSVISNATISLVLSNRKDAFGLERARNAGIDTAYMNLVPYGRKFPSQDSSVKYGKAAREAYDADLAARVLEANPDLVVCAGWMHILSPSFLKPLANANIAIINLHPALPGEYNGARAIERAYEDFQAKRIERTGVFVHYVIQEVDCGAPIVEQEIPINAGDSLEDLQDRIHAAEHKLLVRGVNIVLKKRLATKPASPNPSASR